MDKNHVIIECNCAPVLVRILSILRRMDERQNVTEDSIANIYELLDNLDDINDILDAQEEIISDIEQIAMRETSLTEE